MQPEVDMAVMEIWFDRAMAVPEPERTAVLGTAPAGLRPALRRLIISVDGAEAALESPRWAVVSAESEREASAPPDTATSRTDALPPGARVGGFTIAETIGRGGMGVVYRAEQDKPRREVALKVLATPLLTERARRQFEREAELLARLSHPGIVPVFEVGVIGPGQAAAPYFAMELVDGRPLMEWSRPVGEPEMPPWKERLDLLARVCDAVEHAHQRGVLHRDLKPANMIVGVDGRPRILDFGVGRLLLPEQNELGTVGADVAGTPAYMSPELLLAGTVDTRSDIYALGVIAWEVLGETYPFGTPPHSIESALARARQGIVRPLCADMLPRDARAVLLKAIDPDPERRYRSAGEFGDDLRSLRDGLPVSARTPTAAYVVSRWVGRRPRLAGAALAGATAIVGLGAWAILGSVEARRESRERLRVVELAQRRLDASREFISQSLVRTAYFVQGLPGGHRLHAELLRDALPRLEALAAEAGDDLDLICDLSDAMVSLSHSAGGLGTPNTGEPALAELLMARAMELSQRAVARAPMSSRALVSLEQAVWGAANLPSGVPRRKELFARSIELTTRVYELNGRRPEDEYRLAYRLQVYGSFTGDLEVLTSAVERFEHLLSLTPDDWERRTAFGSALGVLAGVRARTDPHTAAAEASRADAMLTITHAEYPESYSCVRHLVFARVARGSALARLGRIAEAEASLHAALDALAANATDPTHTVHVDDRAETSTGIMEAVAVAVDTAGIESNRRHGLLDLGLRAHSLARLDPLVGRSEATAHLAPLLRRADELAAAWRESVETDRETGSGQRVSGT